MPTLPQVSRLSLKNILFPTDFSLASRSALPFAQTLAQTYGSTILIAHSLPLEPHRQVTTDCVPSEDNRVWQDARHQLESVAHDPSFAKIPAKVLLGHGDLADTIPAMIEDNSVDLVVLGTHGRRGVTKLMLGSGAEKIYRTSPCPVFTVGPRVRESADWKLRRVLCPVDVSEDPEPVLQCALSLAEENQAELIVLEAIPLVPWQHRPSVEQRSRLALESLIPAQVRDWCTPQIVVRWEHPTEAILNEAQERNIDLVVMSVHRSRAAGWSSHLPWPVASEVVSRASCPVLTIRI